jgi:type IV secretory pathway VirB2 component (pilin)
MKSRTLRRSSLLVPALVGAALTIAIPNTARAAAANGGQPLPWEGPLNQVLASFTGPVAKALCILAIVVSALVSPSAKAAVCGASWVCCWAFRSR